MRGSLASIEFLSFDCYGTLVDWEEGLASALRPLFERRGLGFEEARVLEAYGRAETRGEAPGGAHRPYREVLRAVVRELAESFGLAAVRALDPRERDILCGSLPDWPLFPDTVPALRRLQKGHKLVVISNVDRDLFAGTARRLGIGFHAVITAEEARAYKPSPEVFTFALERLGTGPDRILHVAQSLFHDIAPATSLGWRTVHLDRRKGRAGGGATPPSGAEPDFELGGLPELEELLRGTGRP